MDSAFDLRSVSRNSPFAWIGELRAIADEVSAPA
jgi:hypothetical protein